MTQPWAITPDGLRLTLGVWSRGEFFAEELVRARAARGGLELSNEAPELEVRDGVAILPIRGVLFRHASMLTEVSGAASYTAIGKLLEQAQQDPTVRAILLLVDSPGGEANGVAELASRIRAASKPVVAYAEGTCASAAYWLASAASEVLVASTAVVGSIGCVIATIDDSGEQEALGRRRVEIISSQSPGKRGSPVDDAVKGRLQTRADDLAAVFVAAVAQHRGVSADHVLENYGAGDVLVGQKAVTAGLADRLGDLDSALAAARARATTRGAAPAAPGSQPGRKRMENETSGGATATATPAEPGPQEKWNAVQPLLGQVAALTGKATPEEQQLELARIGVRAARADELERAFGDERQQLLAQARAKGIPPVAMAGWEHLSLTSLREVVAKTQGLQLARPGKAPDAKAGVDVGENPSTPAASDVTLTAEDRAEFARCGVHDEAQMLKIKRSMKGRS